MTPLGMSTGYSRDFAEIGTAADALRKKAHGDSGKIEALGAAESAELARLEVRRALLTESPSDYPRAALALDFARVANAENAAAKDELLLLAARLDLQYGRVGGVRKWLALLPPDAPLPELYALRAELAFVTGEYVVADRAGRKSIAVEGGDAAALAAPAPDPLRWERLLGQSEREATVGSSEDAVEHARLAEESLPTGNDPAAVQARARYELRVGRSEFERGNYGLAEIHYGTAERIYPGYWKTRERQAELRGAQERYAEATALYEEIIETEPRPEWLESLGDLYAHVSKPDAAKPFQDRALIAYRASAARGEPLAYHHLARILSDVRKRRTRSKRSSGRRRISRNAPASPSVECSPGRFTAPAAPTMRGAKWNARSEPVCAITVYSIARPRFGGV